MRGFKYRIYPTPDQEILINKHMGCARLVYNLALSTKIEAYKTNRTNLSGFDLMNQLPDLKDGFEFLKEVNAQSLQASIKNLETSYKNFFKHKFGFPKYKAKHCSRQSFTAPQHIEVDFEKSLLIIPKFKEGIKTVFHRIFHGIIKRATITKTPSGKYFASILVDTPQRPIEAPTPTIERSIGIDVNLKNFATYGTIDGRINETVENPKNLAKALEKIKTLQRRVSRKKKGSNNRAKAIKRLAIAHERVTNKRSDFLHKLSHRLTHENQVDTVCCEDLNVSGMIKNRNLSRAISDVGWGKFDTFLTYKCAWYGKNFLQCGRFDPTSKQCECGENNNDLTLNERIWTCKKCNTENIRDELAFRNIIRFAFKKYNKNRAGAVQIEACGEGVSRSSNRMQSPMNQEILSAMQEALPL